MNPQSQPVIQQYLAANPYKAPQQTQQPKSQGNWFTHLLPTIGGTVGGVGGGAIGGALAGSAILPGIGTAAGGLLGALLGGSAGGAAGKAVENSKEGKKLTSGVAQQALEQGALSAGPLRLLKGVGAAGAATGEAVAHLGEGGTGNALVDALNAAGNAATKPGIAGKALTGAKNATADNSAQGFGVGVGQRIGGNTLTPKDSAALQDFIQNRSGLYGGIKASSPIQQAVQAQVVHDNVTNALANQLDTINRTVTPEETSGIAAAMRQAAAKNPALTGSSLSPLGAIAQQVTGATDLKGLEAARMAADKLAYPNGTDLASSQLAQQGAHARDAIDKFVSTVPKDATPAQAQAINDYKAIKGDYGASKQLVNATSQANGSASGIHIPLLGGSVGTQAINGAANKGNALLAGITGKTAAPYGAGAITGRVVGGNALEGAINTAKGITANANQSVGSATQAPVDLVSAINQATQGQQDAANQDTSSRDANNPFSQQNIEGAIANDISQTGGKNITQLLALYNAFGKPDAAQQNLTTNQKNEVVSQQKATEALNAYMGLLQQAGGAEGPIKGAIDSSIIGGYTNPAAQAMDKQRIDIASAIAGSLNPRGTVSPTVARTIAESLPSIHDTPQAQAMKLQSLMAQIKAGAYSAQTPVSTLVANNTGGQ